MPYDSSKLPNCLDCGKKLSAPHVLRCAPCAAAAKVGAISPNRIGSYERHPDNVRLIKRTCTICGKECWQSITYHKRPTAYCSQACRNKAPHKPYKKRGINHIVSGECLKCGNSFTYPSSWDRKSPRRFCSKLCYRRYAGETHPESNVRACLSSLGVEFIQEHRIGRYRVDFFLPARAVTLEVDAAYWHAPDTEKDRRRDDYMQACGFRVVRIDSAEVTGDITETMMRLIRDRLDA